MSFAGTAPTAQTGSSPSVECRLDSAHDLAALLAALQLREKEQKDQRVHCEASARGLKLVAQSAGKDVAVLGWMFDNAFREYKFTGGDVDELHLRLPVAPLLSCLTIFSERAALTMRYPSGPANDVHFTLEEDGATTECRVRTLVLEEAPQHVTFFSPDDPVRNMSVFRTIAPEAWYLALAEFEGLDQPDVVLRMTLRNAPGPPASMVATQRAPAKSRGTPAVVLRAQTITSDAEVEVQREALDEFKLSPTAEPVGEVSHQYLLSSVLSCSLRAAKDAKAVKVRVNDMGVMSTQFILRSRVGQRDQLFCEALICPLHAATPGADARRDWSPVRKGVRSSVAGGNPHETTGLGGDSTAF